VLCCLGGVCLFVVQFMQQMEGQGGQEESIALEHVVAQQRNVLGEAKVVVICTFISLLVLFHHSLLATGHYVVIFFMSTGTWVCYPNLSLRPLSNGRFSTLEDIVVGPCGCTPM
jgi:hypothetical protein